MDALTVSFHGLTNSADAAARSMLRLLLPMLGDRWQIAESGHSDVVILEAEALESLRNTGSASEDTLYVVFSRDAVPPPGAFATIARPLNSARLVELLHRAQDELERRMLRPDNTTIAETVVGDIGEGQNERRVRTTMRTAIGWILQDDSRAVTVRDLQQSTILSVLPEVGFATRLRSNNLADLIRTDAPIDLIDLTEAEQAGLRDRHKFAPLLKLEWIYWLAGSDGKIRPGLTVSHRYQLRKYPDFGVLPHYRGDVRMASLLKAEPLTVGELAQRAGVRLETACHFVNACWALDLLGNPAARMGSGRAAPHAEAVTRDNETLLAAE